MSALTKKLRDMLAPTLARAGYFGHDVFIDIKKRVPSFNPSVIVDVGANVGDFAVHCAGRFPRASIFAFEPGQENYCLLASRTNSLNVEALKLGLSSSSGSVNFVHDHANPTMSHIVKDGEGAERVDLVTLDDFLAERGIDRVSYLKIDTEGFDLEVLKGAAKSFAAGLIDFVEVEAGINPDNDYHSSFRDLIDHLFSEGYFIFGFYEQVMEWTKSRPYLRRSNVVFMKAR